MSIIISLLALLLTFYQLRLQRIHNEKSLKPLGQIDLPDHKKKLGVHIRNNGLGPLIIDRLSFTKRDNIYSSIADCLDLDPKSYMHISASDLVKRVILPNSHLAVFEKNFGEHADEAHIDHVRTQLSPITLKVEGRDIYDNRIVIERSFQWFSRYIQNETVKP
ncbi:hypothetical protein IC229_29815 [Spirosoma sp. BT702]|uniref:Uncharacterized protein n=1 Tax=Spirosoma profusum TaxID=2771354 RepID=A0A927AUY3_9BACT|nr:hypothetical protein [Spirosoma profusum]